MGILALWLTFKSKEWPFIVRMRAHFGTDGPRMRFHTMRSANNLTTYVYHNEWVGNQYCQCELATAVRTRLGRLWPSALTHSETDRVLEGFIDDALAALSFLPLCLMLFNS